MEKWNASVSVMISIDYYNGEIEAETEEEAEQIAKDKAMEDIDYNNCSCDSEPIVCVWTDNEEGDEENGN